MTEEFNMIDTLLSVGMTLIGFIVAIFWNRLTKVEEKSNYLEVLVNGKYQLRSEAEASNEKILNKLDEIKEDINTCRLEHHGRRKNDSHDN